MVINKTQLDLDKAEERQIVHRDYIAHVLRWTHILKNSSVGERILDLGCADAPLAMAFYTNKFKPEIYVGVDIRKNLIEENQNKKFNFLHNFINANLITEFHKIPIYDYTIITCLEVLEHVEKDDGLKILDNISSIMKNHTICYLSTPCFNGSKAGNHVYERTYEELYNDLNSRFKIEKVYGTFISQKDFLQVASLEHKLVFEQLKTYYDSNLLAILFAPLYPSKSRNCIWRLRKIENSISK